MSGKRYTEEFKIAAVKQVARWYRWRQCHRNEPRLIREAGAQLAPPFAKHIRVQITLQGQLCD